MIRRLNKKGVGWMPDDIASIFFALLLIAIGFIIFNNVNDLVAKPVTENAFELHNMYEQQRLLQTYLQTPLVINGTQNDAQGFIAEFILLDYWLTQHPNDTSAKERRDILESKFILDEFQKTMNYYQPLSKEIGLNPVTNSGIMYFILRNVYAKDVYFIIKLIDTNTGNVIHSYAYPNLRKIMKQETVQAMASIPTTKLKDFGPTQYVVVIEIREPEIRYKHVMTVVPGNIFFN